MNKSNNDHRIIEDQLADFTDRMLERTAVEDKEKLAQDPELRALEQTAQRLKSAFSEDGPSEEVIQKMRQNIILEWKQRESQASNSFWRKFSFVQKPREQKWQSQRDRQHWSMIRSLASLAVVMLISILLLNKTDFDQPAASGQSLNSGVLAATGVLLLFLWIIRRKL
jgi:hypothetical protein